METNTLEGDITISDYSSLFVGNPAENKSFGFHRLSIFFYSELGCSMRQHNKCDRDYRHNSEATERSPMD